jgi:CRISPR-associated protein Cst1
MSFLSWTGNPFVDSGIAATLAYCRKNYPEEIELSDLEAMKRLLLKVYVEPAWRKSFHNIFTGNCKLLQNAFQTDARRNEEYAKFLDALLSETTELGVNGNCIACGQRNAVSRKSKVEIPMTGSGSSKGFFPSAAEGADFCETCAFIVQCSPLNYYVCGGAKFLVLHSASEEIQKAWAQNTIDDVNRQIAQKTFTGSLNEGYTNPQNALFRITSGIARNLNRLENGENVLISLYHFSNYLQNPELYVYEMPAPVFRFVMAMQHAKFRDDWQGIVRRGFFFRQKGKQIPLKEEKITDEEFKKKQNSVYLDLLNGKSIIPKFFSRREKRVFCDFALLRVYLKEVLFMNDQRIETIKRVADEIATFIRQSPRGKRRLRDLEISVKFRDFCNALRKISKERIELNPDKPLFTVDEFAKELFPEGSYRFGDIRYLILFRLYEQLHDWLREQGEVAENEDAVKEIDDKADIEEFAAEEM